MGGREDGHAASSLKARLVATHDLLAALFGRRFGRMTLRVHSALVLSLALYGAVLVLAPRLMKAGEGHAR